MPIDNKKILILGGSGYVGRHLFAKLGPQRAIATYHNNVLPDGIRFDATTMSLSDILDAEVDVSYAIILLGETNIDKCAKDKAASRFVNVEGIIKIIKELKTAGIKPMFISSDNVFDGFQGGYSETDKPNPITSYGKYKVEVETFVRDLIEDHCIVRLTKVYGDTPGDGTAFTDWANSLIKGDLLRVATDQVFSPTHIDDVVDGIIRLLEMNAQGIYHLCGPDAASRAAFLDMLIAEMKPVLQSETEVVRCSMNDFPLVEERPLNVSMNSDKFRAKTGLSPKSVQSILPGIVAAYQNSPNS